MAQKGFKYTTKEICFAAIFMALNIAVSTFSIPVPGGHFYINDMVICTAAILLDPFLAFCVGGVGAFLGDLLFYPTPMFVSLVTHGLQAIVVSLCARKLFAKKQVIGASVGVLLGAFINVVGYSFGRAFIYATVPEAILKLPYQTGQALLGAVVSIIICYIAPVKRLLKIKN